MAIGKHAEAANFNKYESFVGPQKRKRVKTGLFGFRMFLLVLYFIPNLLFIFYISGLYFIILSAIFIVLAYVISEMLYRPRSDVSKMEEVSEDEKPIDEYSTQEDYAGEVDEKVPSEELYEEDDDEEYDAEEVYEEEGLDDASEFLDEYDCEDDEDFD